MSGPQPYPPQPNPSQPYPPQPYPPQPYAPPERRTSTANTVVTWLLVLALGIGCVIASFFGLFVAMVSDGCFEDNCNDALIMSGVGVATLSPWLVLAVVVLWAAFRLRAGKLAWWVPLLGAAVVPLLWIGGAMLAGSGVS